jgi:hypothetical protein
MAQGDLEMSNGSPMSARACCLFGSPRGILEQCFHILGARSVMHEPREVSVMLEEHLENASVQCLSPRARNRAFNREPS